MKEDKTTTKSSVAKENEPVLENGKKKVKEEKPATKVVVRRLPPSMTEEQFKLQVAPLPDFDYFYFVAADKSLTPNAFSRAYINFIDQTDLFIFTQKFDGYVFLDSKGGEFPAVVEFAPFQRIPKNRPNRKKDPKVGTIEADPLYSAFKERVEAESLENRTANTSKQHFFETSLVPEKKEMSNTPLLDYIKTRRAERQRIRDEKRDEKRKKDLERRKAKEEQRRTKKEDETSVVKVLNNQNTSKDRAKEKEIKQSFVKKKSDEVKATVKEKSTVEARSKENKTRTGKSYLEERQRQAERRKEQRKKQFQNQSSNSLHETKSATAEEKITANEEKPSDEKPSVLDSKENKVKDSEFKKSERAFKRDEIKKSSYKYESKRDKESDEARKVRRSNNDRSHHQSSRREDEKSEDSGRKRYSESRKNHDSTQRDKFKDKSKSYGQKRVSTTDIGKVKNSVEVQGKASDDNEVKTDDIVTKVESQMKKENELTKKGYLNSFNDVKETMVEDNELISEKETKSTKFLSKDKTKPTRRKSLDFDKNRSTSTSAYSSSKLYNRDKYIEKKRRNSVGSSKNTHESIELSSPRENKQSTSDTKDLLVKKSTSKDELLKVDKPSGGFKSRRVSENKHPEEADRIFEERDLPKRRNSTGQRQVPEKSSPRRNSLGSEDKKEVFIYKEHKFDSEVISEEDKPKDEKKSQRFSRDPRSERRIRNKDRPSIEIYRPGMGKFSKQRLEREKGLGSSTEMESPSSSPSPTPVFKHKPVSAHH